MKTQLAEINIINSETRIAVMLKNGSIGELDMFMKKDDPDVKQWNLTGKNIFWFSRLKSVTEGQGDGTLIMKNLIKIFDDRKVSVICGVNPYGKMDMKTLVSFYKKFGFVLVDDEGTMIRNPK